jgi:hypothetical protein
LLWAAAALAATSCSGSTLGPDGGGQLQPDGAGSDAGLPTGGFITADVDGVTIRGEMQAVSYWWSGIQEGSIAADAHNGEWQWSLILRNATGRATCSGVLQVVGSAAMSFGSFGAEGGCATNVTTAALNVGDVLEGTFTATLRQVNGATLKQVSNGAFRVPRIAAPP